MNEWTVTCSALVTAQKKKPVIRSAVLRLARRSLAALTLRNRCKEKMNLRMYLQ